MGAPDTEIVATDKIQMNTDGNAVELHSSVFI
jgi:hypothetical protein